VSQRRLITFGGAAYDEITARVTECFVDVGATSFLVYDDRWLDAHPFRQLNAWLWDHEGSRAYAPKGRGYGLYAWKPLIILDAMRRSEPGDIVCYIDGDSAPVADISIVFETADRDGAMLFRSSGHDQRRWCTRDCEIVMGLNPSMLDAKRIHGRADYLAPGVAAGCARWAAFKVGPYKPQQLLYEWLTFSINPMTTTFEPSILGPEPEGMQEHRTEQAVLSLLAHKYGYTLWREADQDGLAFRGQPGEPGEYGQLFEQQRRGGPFPLGHGSKFRNVPMPEAW